MLQVLKIYNKTTHIKNSKKKDKKQPTISKIYSAADPGLTAGERAVEKSDGDHGDIVIAPCTQRPSLPQTTPIPRRATTKSIVYKQGEIIVIELQVPNGTKIIAVTIEIGKNTVGKVRKTSESTHTRTRSSSKY
jgi:hypothetical protein